MELRRQTLDMLSGALGMMQRGLATLHPPPSTGTDRAGRTSALRTEPGSRRAGAARVTGDGSPPPWDYIRGALRERAWLPEYGARMPDDPED